MKITIGARQTGKSSYLLDKLAKEEQPVTIICPNMHMADYFNEKLPENSPHKATSVSVYLKKPPRGGKVMIDDLDLVLKYLFGNVIEATATANANVLYDLE